MSNGGIFPWLEYVSLNETDSTNNQVLLLDSDKEIVLVSAEYQSSGRGQRGNSWESEKGKNLVLSMLIRPDYVASNEQFILSQAISLAIQQTLSDLLGSEDVKIKWPNDIYWKDKKICGILIENSLFGKHIEKAVLGVGLNVNQKAFCSDAPNPVSLSQISGKDYEREKVLLQIVDRFHAYLELLKKKQGAMIVHGYFEHLYRKNGFYPYRDENGEFLATIKDVEPMGHLILEDKEKKVRRYAFKEVEYIL